MDVWEQKSAERYFGFIPAGIRSFRRSRQSGNYVGIYHSEEQGLDPCINDVTGKTEGRYTLVCEKHGETVAVRSITFAREHAADPFGWCASCREMSTREGEDW